MILRLLGGARQARRWIADQLEAHQHIARPVAALGFGRLERYLPTALLESSKVVVVNEVPDPPVHEWGLGELGGFGGPSAAGITFRDTVFIRRDEGGRESLLFHELIHVIQWRQLGLRRFLAAYGLSLLLHDYLGNPLEVIAFEMQERFETDDVPFAVVEPVEQHAEQVVVNLKRESPALRLAWPLISRW